jgi:hypothetical protein
MLGCQAGGTIATEEALLKIADDSVVLRNPDTGGLDSPLY